MKRTNSVTIMPARRNLRRFGAYGSAILAAAVLVAIPQKGAVAGAASACGQLKTVDAKMAAISRAIDSHFGEPADVVTAAIVKTACVSRLRPVSGTAMAKPSVSDNDTDMNVSKPIMFYDDETRKYYVEALWSWKNNDYSADIPDQSCNVSKSDGGVDGFAVSFSGNVHWTSYTLQHHINGNTRWSHGPWSKTVAQTANAAGVGFVDQDTIYMDGCVRDNSMYGGDIVGSFTALNGCMNVDARSSYAHTWSSTSVTGISIGISATGGSIGYSWKSVGHQWTNTSQTSDIERVC